MLVISICHEDSIFLSIRNIYTLSYFTLFPLPEDFYDASQKPHTESSEQDRVPVIQMYNEDSQQDSQSHTQHVYDATYPAMLVTYASGLLSK